MTENVYILTIPYDSEILDNVNQKAEFLQALCEEYRNFVINKYYTQVSVGMLYGQQLKAWDESSEEIIWDPFRYDINFSALNNRYQELAGILTKLYNADPNYRTAEGRNFNDYANELREIYIKDIAAWDGKLVNNLYIRNIDQFIEEAQYRIATIERNRDYYKGLVESYSDLLASFQQADAQGVIVEEAVEILTAAQAHAVAASDLQRQMDQMILHLTILSISERTIRNNSVDAEAALIGFIDDLERNQENLRGIIYDYYAQRHGRTAESAVLYSNALVIEAEDQPPADGVSMTRILMILIGLTFVGFVIGFCATFVKKYIAEK